MKGTTVNELNERSQSRPSLNKSFNSSFFVSNLSFSFCFRCDFLDRTTNCLPCSTSFCKTFLDHLLMHYLSSHRKMKSLLAVKETIQLTHLRHTDTTNRPHTDTTNRPIRFRVLGMSTWWSLSEKIWYFRQDWRHFTKKINLWKLWKDFVPY